jgi:hypothetical protein
MVAKRDCQKVLLRRPFTGIAVVGVARRADAFKRGSERWAAARDPPSQPFGQPTGVIYADMTLGGHAGPPRSRTKIHPTVVRERNSSWQVPTLHRVSISARGQSPRSPA